MSTPFLKFSKKVFSKTLTIILKCDMIYKVLAVLLYADERDFIHSDRKYRTSDTISNN